MPREAGAGSDDAQEVPGRAGGMPPLARANGESVLALAFTL